MASRDGRKRLFRFSLAALLFLMLCVAGYLGGYRSGFDDGKQAQQAAVVYVKIYPVADLITPLGWPDTTGRRTKGLDKLVDLIVSGVARDSWTENGTGVGEIQPFPSNNSLVVSQTQRVHEQLAALLEQLRKPTGKVEVDGQVQPASWHEGE